MGCPFFGFFLRCFVHQGQNLFGQFSVSRNFAAKDVDQFAGSSLILGNHIIASGFGGFVSAVVKQRAHAREMPDHILWRDRVAQVIRGNVAQIFDLRIGNLRRFP